MGNESDEKQFQVYYRTGGYGETFARYFTMILPVLLLIPFLSLTIPLGILIDKSEYLPIPYDDHPIKIVGRILDDDTPVTLRALPLHEAVDAVLARYSHVHMMNGTHPHASPPTKEDFINELLTTFHSAEEYHALMTSVQIRLHQYDGEHHYLRSDMQVWGIFGAVMLGTILLLSLGVSTREFPCKRHANPLCMEIVVPSDTLNRWTGWQYWDDAMIFSAPRNEQDSRFVSESVAKDIAMKFIPAIKQDTVKPVREALPAPAVEMLLLQRSPHASVTIQQASLAGVQRVQQHSCECKAAHGRSQLPVHGRDKRGEGTTGEGSEGVSTEDIITEQTPLIEPSAPDACCDSTS